MAKVSTSGITEKGLTAATDSKALNSRYGAPFDPENSTDVTLDELEDTELEDSSPQSSFKVDKQSYYDRIDNLPNIIVTRITLENTGGDIVPENNPHIDDVEGANIVYDDFGNPEFVSKGIDYLSKTTTSSSLSVKVEMIIKEILDASGVGTWYDNELLTKYMNLRIVLSYSEKFTEQIQTGQYGLEPKLYAESEHKKYTIEKIININNSLKDSMNKYDYTTDEDGEKIYDVAFETEFILKNLDPRHISIFACAFIDIEQITIDYGCGAGNIKAVGLQSTIGPITGEQVINQHQINNNGYVFLTPENKLWVGPVHFHEDAGYMAGAKHTDISHPSLRRILIDNQKINDLRGAQASDLADIEFTIIENKLLNLNIGVLERSVVDFERLDEYFSQIYGTRDKHGNFRSMFGFNYQKFLRDKTEYGKLLENPNLKIVRDIINACTLSFMKISRARVEDLVHLNALGSPIKGRIRFGSNKVSTIIHEIPKEVIVYTTEDQTGRLRTARRLVDDERKTIDESDPSASDTSSAMATGYITEVDVFPSIDGNVKHYALADYDISAATDGLYRYEVEIVMEDGTQPYLRKLSERLRMARKSLVEYHNEAIRKINGYSNYNSVNKKFSQTFINHKNNQYRILSNGKIRGSTDVVYMPASREKNPTDVPNHEHTYVVNSSGTGKTSTVNGHYHEVSQFRFDGAVLKSGKKAKDSHAHATKVLGSRKSAPWIKPVAEYVEILDIITCGTHGVDIIKFSKTANKLMKPETGNPEGIMRIAKLINDLHIKVLNLLDAPKAVDSRSNPKKLPTERKRVRFKKEFDYIFDSNVLKLTGYDYVVDSDSSPVDMGLYMISGQEYVSRVKRETLKYFCSEALASINIAHGAKSYVTNDNIYNSELSYLSPAYAEVGGYLVNLLVDCDFEKQKDTLFELESRIMDFNITGVPSIDLPTKDTIEELVYVNLEKMFNAQNITIYDISESDAGSRAGFLPTTVERCIENVRTYFGGDQRNMIAEGMVLQDLTNSDIGSATVGFSRQFKKENNVALSSAASALKDSAIKLDETDSPFSNISLQTKIDLGDYDLNNKNNLMENFDENEFYPLPNQVKSLFLKQSSIHQLDILDEKEKNDSVLRFNFELLKTVEVFVGYEKVENNMNLVKKPIWTKLTYDLYNQSVGRTLLCRLKSYSNPSLNVRYKEGISLPTYNEHFLLAPTETIPAKTTKSSNFNLSNIRRELLSKNTLIKEGVLELLEKQTFEIDKINSNMIITHVSDVVSKTGNLFNEQKVSDDPPSTTGQVSDDPPSGGTSTSRATTKSKTPSGGSSGGMGY